MSGNEVVIGGAVRTAVGTFQGSLSSYAPTVLGGMVIREALSRAKVEPEAVDHVVVGNVIHTEPKDMYVSRVAAVNGGIGYHTPCMTVNRLCGSGLQAIVSAAQTVMLGDAKVAVAGGVEVMSRSMHATGTVRTGQRMGDFQVVDMMTGALTDPFGNGLMGVTAENVAKRWQVTRAEQDQFAVQSHKRAAAAIADGRFKDQILAVKVKKKGAEVDFDTDEQVRGDASLEGMNGLRAVFMKDGTVTAGNSSPINDGAAAIVLLERKDADKRGIVPLARVLGYAHAGVEPEVMGVGPIKAVRNLLEKINAKVGDFDVIESNEAFAAQACAVSRELGFASEKTNPNGGAIALGHPVGATGVILTTKAIYELKRTGAERALVTMCIGGGQGIALAIERIH
ncbi:MAG: beta-ketothiolase BktB [Xanthobacteraceae bacterium]|jgi:acetyl-CoA C-acetyltransferase|nr:beta-ketothiolase BktB [Xanthobacteraceae bacterium]